eukprot:CAMPEP_0116059194 /NCGR_PEP_ID=MMETSP0322-20121206/5650_1 /TAXON_ID=163516 /ORGANISM="Leptocylindrus danicus var. apora, Strain B651" /LENGTH=413 /DNA_ID=CAMNT_0003543527 /DNA_START=624 /DNA_END=1865 /DNA_ORIENTATION=-
MTEAMVSMVTTQLLSIEEVFKRLDPRQIADLLTPEIPKLTKEIGSDLFPKWFLNMPDMMVFGRPLKDREILKFFNRRFVSGFTVEMQENIGSLLNLRNCVVDQMVEDRAKLGELFQNVASAELSFLVNSGIWFGFLLGIIQMVVALFWDNPWTLSIGGTIVGLATNWLALKWIFEPVHPTKFGPWILQGKFLRRQKEVSEEFSRFFANRILRSNQLWNSIFNDPTTAPAFNLLFTKHLTSFISTVMGGLGIKPEQKVIDLACERAVQRLPEHIGVIHDYVDQTLGLEDTLRTRMQAMTSEKFERVLHPIFEEDELTLIIAGGVLGFLAGLVQQGLETGSIVLPSVPAVIAFLKQMPQRIQRLPAQITTLFATAYAFIRGRKNGRSRTESIQKDDPSDQGEIDTDLPVEPAPNA